MSLQTASWLVLAFPLAGTILLGLLFRVLPGRVAGIIGDDGLGDECIADMPAEELT